MMQLFAYRYNSEKSSVPIMEKNDPAPTWSLAC